MRTVDQANTDAKRAAFVTAAVHCLGRDGVTKTSISDIAKQAGMRSSHLYYYFPTKDALFMAILEHYQEQAVALAEHMFDGDEDIVSQIVGPAARGEAERVAQGLTPIVRMELVCYFSREDGWTEKGQKMMADMTDAIRRSAQKARAAGRLPDHLDLAEFADVIALIYGGISYFRLSPVFDIEGIRKTVQFLIAPLLGAAQGHAEGTAPRARVGV